MDWLIFSYKIDKKSSWEVMHIYKKKSHLEFEEDVVDIYKSTTNYCLNVERY